MAAKGRDDFPTNKLKAEADVLRFAAGLERGAASAYLNAVPLFNVLLEAEPVPPLLLTAYCLP